jgi:elongation factor P
MSVLTMNDLRIGVAVTIDKAPYVVLWSDFMRTAQRKPVMRTKLKNLISGRILEQTFKPGDKIQEADLSRTKGSYLYVQGQDHYFMDQETYDQFFLTTEQLGDQVKYLKEGLEVDVLRFEDKPVTIQLPKKIEYTVTEAPDAVRGDTATNTAKTITLDNGLQVKAPLFIKNGEKILVNTETGEYAARAGE